MPPKKKTAAKEVAEVPEPTPAQTQSKPPTTKPVEPLKKQVPMTQPPEPSAEKKPLTQPGQAERSSKPSTIIKLNQPQKKMISLETQAKSQKQLRQLRAFKFCGKQTAISIDDASKLMSQRAKKFGGNVPLTSQQKRRRQQKFGNGNPEGEQEKELRKKRMEKFGIKPKQTLSQTLPEQETEILEARRKKFIDNSAQIPQPQKRIKAQ